jgi:hypothetical protein
LGMDQGCIHQTSTREERWMSLMIIGLCCPQRA